MKISKLEYVKMILDVTGQPYHDYCEQFGIQTKHLTKNEAQNAVDLALKENGITVADEATPEIRPLTADEFRNILFTNSHSGTGLTNELIKRGLVIA